MSVTRAVVVMAMMVMQVVVMAMMMLQVTVMLADRISRLCGLKKLQQRAYTVCGCSQDTPMGLPKRPQDGARAPQDVQKVSQTGSESSSEWWW